MKPVILGLLLAAGAALPAHAAVLDDFNRPDAPTLGPNWTNVAGGQEIINNQARSLNGEQSTQMAIFNGGSGNEVDFDLFHGNPGTQYGAAVLNYDASNDYFVKVQDNGGGQFDSYAFYTGNNGGGLFASLTTPFTDGHVSVSIAGTVATLVVTPTGGPAQTYTYDYGGTAFGGTGIGLGFYGDARLDNFANGNVAGVPEPTTWALMLVGFGLAGTAVRARQRRTMVTA